MATSTLQVGGVISAPATPFLPDLSLDEEGIQRNATRLIDEGGEAILAVGSIGEHVALNDEEWAIVVRLTIKAACRRVPVIVAVGHTDVRKVQDRVRLAYQLGAEAVMVLPPYYFPLSADELFGFFKTVNECDVPFLVYSNPTTGGPALRVTDLPRLCELEHFIGLKDATPNVVEFMEKRRVLPKRLPLIAAAETQAAFALLAGANGILTATATFAPAFTRRMWEAAKNGDMRRLQKENARLMAFRRVVDAENAKGSPGYISVSKAALELRGMSGGPPRPPLNALGDHLRMELARVLVAELGLTLPEPHRS
jgi:4-hydroxy-tetrahydrodipicolinate synthase